MLGPGVFILATLGSIVASALALRGAGDSGLAWCAAAITGLEALLLGVLVLGAVASLL